MNDVRITKLKNYLVQFRVHTRWYTQAKFSNLTEAEQYATELQDELDTLVVDHC